LRQLEALEWSATLQRNGGGVRFAGDLRTRIELACVRCLQPISEDVSRGFDLFFETRESQLFENNQEVELNESDIDTAFIVGSELHVDEVMREQVVLSVPMKPLCSPECKGLCSNCGANLNQESCGCSTRVSHPAFESLIEFKKRLEDRGDSAG
jgi:uncharacterized protein